MNEITTVVSALKLMNLVEIAAEGENYFDVLFTIVAAVYTYNIKDASELNKDDVDIYNLTAYIVQLYAADELRNVLKSIIVYTEAINYAS